MQVLFNNCDSRDHVSIFGADAFFDLNLTGRQAGQATNLVCGQECGVVSQNTQGAITIRWYSFQCEERMRSEIGEIVRVFRGQFLRAESMTKKEAAAKASFSQLFNKLGQFKQTSVVIVPD